LLLDTKDINKSTRREGDRQKKTREGLFVNDNIYGKLIFSIGYPTLSYRE